VAYDLNQIKVCGRIRALAEEEFGGSFDDDEAARKALDELWAQYVGDGSPGDVAHWAREKLSRLFRCLNAPPSWALGSGRWPFIDGKPMVFLGEIPIPSTELSESSLVPNSVLYVFGGRHRTQTGGLAMQYRVVEQHAELKNVVAVPTRKA
jgi:hypothetical protein